MTRFCSPQLQEFRKKKAAKPTSAPSIQVEADAQTLHPVRHVDTASLTSKTSSEAENSLTSAAIRVLSKPAKRRAK